MSGTTFLTLFFFGETLLGALGSDDFGILSLWVWRFGGK